MVNRLKLFFANTGKRRIVYFFLIIVIILSASLYLQKNKMEQQMQLKVQFIEQKNMLRDELDDIIDEHDDLKMKYAVLKQEKENEFNSKQQVQTDYDKASQCIINLNETISELDRKNALMEQEKVFIELENKRLNKVVLDKQDDINKINETSLMHVSCIDEKHGKELGRLINAHEKSIGQFKENISCLNKDKSELALALEKAQAEIKDLQINRN